MRKSPSSRPVTQMAPSVEAPDTNVTSRPSADLPGRPTRRASLLLPERRPPSTTKRSGMSTLPSCTIPLLGGCGSTRSHVSCRARTCQVRSTRSENHKPESTPNDHAAEWSRRWRVHVSPRFRLYKSCLSFWWHRSDKWNVPGFATHHCDYFSTS